MKLNQKYFSINNLIYAISVICIMSAGFIGYEVYTLNGGAAPPSLDGNTHDPLPVETDEQREIGGVGPIDPPFTVKVPDELTTGGGNYCDNTTNTCGSAWPGPL